ncbi:MAG: hypothetical protein OXG51_10445 [Gammaproteobacteria bacterium]|nr:hypothetical protein [Gammaproteobacteria bacterium]
MRRPLHRPRLAGFGLSFLDVLCCGLGSTVLLLLIVKHGPTDVEAADAAYVVDRTQRAEADIAAAQARRSQLQSQRTARENALAARLASLQVASNQQTAQAIAYAALLEELKNERANLRANAAKLRESQAAAPIPEPSVETRAGKQQLTGINVQGDRVAIFLDRSGSMLHRSLVEIIRLRASGPAFMREAEKWTGAQQAALWAYQQVTREGRFQVFTYAEDLRDLDGRVVKPGGALGWRVKAGSDADPKLVAEALAENVPSGPTDLKQVFEAATRLNPKPRQVLILTDGFPTLPGTKRLGSLRGCRGSNRGTKAVLSPTCRASVYLDAVELVERRLANVPIDVILYPLDGDADAVRGYWLLTALSGGRLLTPAEGWP